MLPSTRGGQLHRPLSTPETAAAGADLQSDHRRVLAPRETTVAQAIAAATGIYHQFDRRVAREHCAWRLQLPQMRTA